MLGCVWEWTESDFEAYPGFEAFPYPEYSAIHFGRGYKVLRGMRKEPFALPDGRACVSYVADFEKKTQTKVDRVRVRWAWTTDGAWIAPDNPRWQFAGQLRAPVLYKVYVATPLPEPDGEESPEDDATTKAFVAATWAQYSAAFSR